MLLKETIHLAKLIMERTGSNSFTTPTSLQLTYNNMHILLSMKEGMWFCRHTPHVTLGKATVSISKNHSSSHAQSPTLPQEPTNTHKTLQVSFNIRVCTERRNHWLPVPHPACSIFLHKFTAASIFLSCSPTRCMNSLPGTLIWPTSSSKHSLPQGPPQNFGILEFPVGIYLEIKQHAMYYSFKNSRFPLRMRIRFLQTFHFQNNSMPTSSTITERTTPQRTRPTAQKGKGSTGKAKKRQRGNTEHLCLDIEPWTFHKS